MSYKSRVDVRLGRIPEVPDEKLYPIFQEVFNAIHILTANIDQTVDLLVPPETSKTPAESFQPRLNTFWAPAAANVTVGRIVTMQGAQFARGVSGYTAGTKRITEHFGVCLEDTDNGKARIAWPPFILEIDFSATTAAAGDIIHSDHSGRLLFLDGADDAQYWPVAQIVDTNMVLFIPNLPS